MISINFQPFNKSMNEVIEYMEKLEVLEATNKQSGTKKGDKEKSEDKTGKSKNKTKKFPKKHSKSKGKKRKRHDSDSEDDRYDKYCAICKAKGGPFWTHDTEDCRTLTGFRKKKQRATQGMTKKEFHALVNTQWKRSVISINFQPFNKSMTEVIEYMEKLEVLEATNKQSSTKKGDKEKSEDKTGKSKNKTKKFPKKKSKSKDKKRKRITLTLRTTSMISTV